jgi:hypothetical protein
MADNPFDGSSTYEVGLPTRVAPSFTLVPVDHDPFNDSGAAETPGDRDAFGTLPQSESGLTNVLSWAQTTFHPGGMIQSQADPGSAFGQPGAVGPFAGSFGWAAPAQSSFAPLAPLQSPFGAGVPPSAMSSGVSPGLPESPAVPPPLARSVLFNRSSGPGELDAPDTGWGSPDQIAKILGSGFPLSKSGAPVVSPNPPSSLPTISSEQWLDAARLVAPNIVDFYTKPIPLPPPFPSTPGKIPSNDNPYGPAALLEAAILLPGLEGRGAISIARGLARVAEEVAPGTVARIIGTAGVGPLATPLLDRAALLRLNAELGPAGQEALARIAERSAEEAAAAGVPTSPLMTGPYKWLRRNLPPDMQAHHVNQSAVFGDIIPRMEGFSVGVGGNAFTKPGTGHFLIHQYMERSLWDPYREGGSLEFEKPMNAEYGAAEQRSYLFGGFSPEQASELAARSAE